MIASIPRAVTRTLTTPPPGYGDSEPLQLFVNHDADFDSQSPDEAESTRIAIAWMLGRSELEQQIRATGLVG